MNDEKKNGLRRQCGKKKESAEKYPKESAEKKAADKKPKELSGEELEKVTGGFGNIPRVPDYDYDESVKEKI